MSENDYLLAWGAYLIAAFGCTLGIVPHMLAAALGLAALVAAEPRLFELIRYAGIAYLIWMAWGMWRDATTPLDLDQASRLPRSPASAFRLGVLTQLANPKVVVFFGSIFIAMLLGLDLEQVLDTDPADWTSAGELSAFLS